MGILKKAMNEQAYLKAGIFGDPGTGKTTTASYLALAIAQKLGSKKPVAFFETEAGSDFMIERFNTEGVELLRVKSHSVADLIEAVKEAESACSCMIVDSITHVWDEVMNAKLKQLNRARKEQGKGPIYKLEFQHHADIKRVWKEWLDLYLNAKLHMLVCGRAGDIWQWEKDEETGKKELQSIGTRMKAEKNFGYEPSLLIEMSRIEKGAGKGWKHRATVLKDRTDTINGLQFDFEKPRKEFQAGDWKFTFKPFEPVFKHLNIGGEHKTVDTTRNSEGLFPGQDGESQGERLRQRAQIALEEIEASMVAIWPGRDAGSSAMKAGILEALFGTRSWTAVQTKKLTELEAAARVIQKFEVEMKKRVEPLASIEELKQVVESVRDPETVTQ